MKIPPRFRLISTIIISTFVLLISIAILTGTWILQGKVSATAVTMLRGLDQSAGVLRNGMIRIDTGFVKLIDTTGKIDAASTKLAQNVSDRGVVRILLPEALELELSAAMNSVLDIYATIDTLIVTTYDTMRAIDNLPFIEAPAKGFAAVEKLQTEMEQLVVLVEGVRTDIQDLRISTATGITRISTSVRRLNNKVGDIRSEMSLIDNDLERIQGNIRFYYEQLPNYLIFISVLITFLTIWVSYSQVLIVTHALTAYRQIQASETDPE